MKTILIILGIIIAILTGFRTYLLFLVKDQVIKNINEAEGISGYVDNLSISLLRGNIELPHIDIFSEGYSDPSRPFIKLAQTDISVNWSSLFNSSTEINLDSLLEN